MPSQLSENGRYQIILVNSDSVALFHQWAMLFRTPIVNPSGFLPHQSLAADATDNFPAEQRFGMLGLDSLGPWR